MLLRNKILLTIFWTGLFLSVTGINNSVQKSSIKYQVITSEEPQLVADDLFSIIPELNNDFYYFNYFSIAADSITHTILKSSTESRDSYISAKNKSSFLLLLDIPPPCTV